MTDPHYLSLGVIETEGEHFDRGRTRFRLGVEHVLEDGAAHVSLVLTAYSNGRWARINLSTTDTLWLHERLARGAALVLEDDEHAGSVCDGSNGHR